MRALIRGSIKAGEHSASALALAKLANVGLTMLWGFAVTFVFARALPVVEFQAFLLLIAFNNFTQSAEFGLTNVIYARLRRYWLARTGQAVTDDAAGNFRVEEIGVVFLFLATLAVAGSLLVAATIHMGWIGTTLPAIFLIFFLASVLNMLLLLVKRTLAALDRNLVWEVLDFVRRVAGLACLVAVLAGLDLLVSVSMQLLINSGAVLLGMVLVQHRLGMHLRQWFAWRVGGGHVRRSYMRDIGASAALTISEVAAYNSPYFLIAALSHDPRLMLIFDFAFKIIRAVTTTTRATIESALPRLTRYWFAGNIAAFRRGVWRASGVALCVAFCAVLVLLLFGRWLFAVLYDGRAMIGPAELGALCGLLLVLSVICVSIYIQGALGRFGALLRQSLPFLAGSLLCAPFALGWSERAAGPAGPATGTAFMTLYALVFAGTATLHVLALRRLMRGAR